MEARQTVRGMSVRPIVFVIVLLSVVAIALTGWYVRTISPQSQAPAQPTVTTALANPGPDAMERNQQLRQERDPEAHHGH